MQNLKWADLWRSDLHTLSIGVEYAIDDATKYYRAFSLGGDQRFESDIYEACDDADIPPTLGQIQSEMRDRAILACGIARAKMTSKQRSANDMREIANELGGKAREAYHAYEKTNAIRKEQEMAATQAAHWIAGITALISHGTEEQKATLTTLAKLLRDIS